MGGKARAAKMTAVAAGISDHVWTVAEIIALLGIAEATPVKHGSYTKTRERRAAEREDSA